MKEWHNLILYKDRMFSLFGTAKKNNSANTRRNRNNSAMKNAAALRAAYTVRSKYGRAGQSRVANVLHPEEGPHNIVAKEQQQLAAQYYAELQSAVSSITPEQTTALSRLRNSLQSEAAQAVKSGAREVAIRVPVAIVNIIVILLNVFLFILQVGLMIGLMALSLAGGASMTHSPALSVIPTLAANSIGSLMTSRGKNKNNNNW